MLKLLTLILLCLASGVIGDQCTSVDQASRSMKEQFVIDTQFEENTHKKIAITSDFSQLYVMSTMQTSGGEKKVALSSISSDFTTAYMKAYNTSSQNFGFDIDEETERMYFMIEVHSTLVMAEGNISNGDILNHASHSGANFATYSSIHIPKGVSIVYFTIDNSGQHKICRWSPLVPSFDCLSNTGGSNIVYLVHPIGRNRVLFGLNINEDFVAQLSDITAPSSEWTFTVPCDTATCDLYMSQATSNDDMSIIYVWISYSTEFLFYAIDTDEGNSLIDGIQISHNGGAKEVIGISQSDDYVFGLLSSDNYYLVVYSKQDDSVKIEFSPGASTFIPFDIAASSDGIIYVAGAAISPHADHFYLAKSHASTMQHLGSYNIDSHAYQNASISFPWNNHTSQSYATFTLTPTISAGNPLTVEDVSGRSVHLQETLSLWAEEETFTVSENVLVELNFTWSCSLDIFENIYFTIVAIPTYSLESWLELGAPSQQIYLNTTPAVTTSTEYRFGLNITGGTIIAIKEFIIIVLPCQASNCDTCSPYDQNKCSNCLSGFEVDPETETCVVEGSLNSTEETEPSDGPKMVAQAIAGAGASVAVVASLSSGSSPQGAFSILNQFQLYILLPMIGAFIPEAVIKVIVGMDFAMFSFSFIPFSKIPVLKQISEWFSYAQGNSYLDEIGLTSGSTIVNQLSLLAIACIFALVHLSIYPLYNHSKTSTFRCYKYVMNKVFKFLTLAFYIRLAMEAYLFILISTVSELSRFDTSSELSTGSLIFSFLFAIFLLAVLGLLVVEYFRSHPQIDEEKQWVCTELFSGLKNHSYSRLFTFIFFLVRICFVFLLIIFEHLSVTLKCILFALIQLVSVIATIALWPFEKTKDSIAEVIYQSFFLVLSGLLIKFNSSSDWSNTIETLYIGLLMCGPIVGSIIALICLIKSIIGCFIKQRQTVSNIAPKVNTTVNIQRSKNPVKGNASSNEQQSHMELQPRKGEKKKAHQEHVGFGANRLSKKSKLLSSKRL